jgi:pyridoxamine 5'-phosphate oxidase
MSLLKKYYLDALSKKQNSIEAIVISSIGKGSGYADARYVNLKYVTDDSLIFFSNYKSKKGLQFTEHNSSLITALIYWNSINTQIRIRGEISICDSKFSDNHFASRSDNKNALAISSYQSQKIDSYESVQKNYQDALISCDLSIRPEFWGGYKIKPVYFEFWKAHKYRLNKREVYEESNGNWDYFLLQP